MTRVITGLEHLAAEPELVRGRRWALLANHAAVDSGLDPARTVLARAIDPPRLLFAPEHGLDGVAQDMEAVADETDHLTGSPVRSLYGHDADTLQPRPEDLEPIEVLVVDLPDIGSRYYTFAATMDAVMAGCAAEGVESWSSIDPIPSLASPDRADRSAPAASPSSLRSRPPSDTV